MRSKLFLGNLVMVVLAGFVVWPAVASASPVLTYPTGTKMVVNSKIRVHGVGTTLFTTSAAKIECTTAEMTGTLVTNVGNDFEIGIESAAFTGTGLKGDCTSGVGEVKVTTNPATNGLPWCIWSTEGIQKPDEFTLSGGKCTEAPRPVRIVLDYTASNSECSFERSGGSPGTFKTHPEDALLTISEVEFTKIAGPFTCPPSFKLDTTLTLEKDEAGTNPIYIS